MADAPSFISEELLAQRLGMDREQLRKMRPRAAQKNGASVQWPWAHAEAVATGLGLTLAAVEVDGVEVLTVASSPGASGWHYPNHHVIQARTGAGELVVVRVVDSRKYVPKTGKGEPMTLQARRAAEGNWWLLVGREPRWKGVW